MEFIKNISKLLNLQKLYIKAYPGKPEGLASIAEKLFDGMKLCKYEQVSNWEARPLRYSQEHYGAMDVWILVVMVPKLMSKFESEQKVNEHL